MSDWTQNMTDTVLWLVEFRLPDRDVETRRWIVECNSAYDAIYIIKTEFDDLDTDLISYRVFRLPSLSVTGQERVVTRGLRASGRSIRGLHDWKEGE